jgi:hypothetical protein
MPTLGGGDMPTRGGGDIMATRGGGISENVIRRGVTVVTSGADGRRADTAGGGGANWDRGVTVILGDEML